MLGVAGTLNAFTSKGKLIDLVWTLPLTVVSLPLLPFYLEGEKFLLEANRKDFQTRTQYLPQVNGVKDFARIEEYQDKFFVYPFHIEEGEEPFNSMEDAKLFLHNLGYQEVVDFDKSTQFSLETLWIKRE
jgi:hypothetical protein